MKRIPSHVRPIRFALFVAVAVWGAACAGPTPTRTDEWLYRRPIVVANPGDVELRDHQIRIALDATNFDFARARPDGADLRFGDEDGRRYLPHWVERYDPSAEQAVVWVKVPVLPPAGERTIFMYYGRASGDDLSSGRRTFEMFDDFGRPGLGYYEFGPATTVMTRTEAWETQAPHTLSVIELNREGYRYWAYYGLADCGGIGLARSNDLVNWQKWPEPLLNRDGERWPAVLKVGEVIYMIYDRDHCGTSHLVMRTSRDGVHFDPDYRVIVPQQPGVRNQNPALFRDPREGRFYLYWYRGGNDVGYWQIRMRSATTVEGLADPASERVLIDVPYELAAPNMLAYDGVYFLSTEVNENAWKTKIYAGPSPGGPFTPLPDAPQLSDNQACLFQHVFTTTMHGYVCKDTGAGWVLNHRSADLARGRSTQRRLDPGVWTAVGGTWQPVESAEALDKGVVLDASGRGVLQTALQGGDYVFEARGRSLDRTGRWGIAVRVQRAQYYLVEVEPSVNGGRSIRLWKIADGRRTELGSVQRADEDAGSWLRLGVAIQGGDILLLHDGAAFAQMRDPGAPLDAGHSALWVDGRAQFDDVAWRKFAAVPPGIRVGAEENFAAARPNWLSPRAADAVEPTAANAPHRALTMLAALFTMIALGIVCAGFVRRRG